MGFPWPCAQQCVQAPPPWHLARWQTNITAAMAGGGERGGRCEAHWDTSSRSLWPQKETDGAARQTPLITLLCFFCGGECLHVHTHRHTRGVLSMCGEKDRESIVYTPEYTVLQKQPHSWSLQSYSFSFSVECSNIKHIIPAFDHVTHWWYRNQCNRYILLQHVKQWATVV